MKEINCACIEALERVNACFDTATVAFCPVCLSVQDMQKSAAAHKYINHADASKSRQ
ncbi:MAG: hypothetical protein ACTTKM_00790 [Prevotella fusca]